MFNVKDGRSEWSENEGKFPRGLEINVPLLENGQGVWTKDTGKLIIGGSNGNVQIANQADVDTKTPKKKTDVWKDVVADYGAKGDGIIDDTTAFQNALDQKGKVFVPSGTYLVGALTISSDTQLIGIGKVTLKHNLNTGYVFSGWDRAMITNANLPTYTDPSLSSASRTNAQGVVSNITIENITLDAAGQNVKGFEFVAVDYLNMKDVTIKNTYMCSLFLVGIRYSNFKNILVDSCSSDPIAMTDKYLGGKRSFSSYCVFDSCTVTNSGSAPSVSDSIPSMYELSDGMNEITFINCRAIGNNGCGFDFHIHTTDWDMTNIHVINCQSINNTMSTKIDNDVAGFRLGQCPSGSSFKNITFENCISIGSQCAFSSSAGSELGYKENVKIIGGYWENAYTTAGTIVSTNVVLYIGKLFRSFKVIGADLSGATDSYAIYTYGTGDGIKISNVSSKGSYIPLGLTHAGGKVEINNYSFNVTNPSSALSSVCLVVECDDVTINGLIGSLDQSKYSSSIFRFIQPKKISLTGLLLENTGTLGGNAVQLDTVGYATLNANVIKNFTNGVYFSNTSTSVVSVGNNFKTCTAKYNTTPAYLVDAGNAI